MSSVPRVTLLMCVFNAGEFLRPAIESALAQTYRNLEILVVDDGSTDGAVEWVAEIRDERLRLLRQPNTGRPGALNAGLAAMTGEFYTVLDADDLCHPTRVAKQVDAICADSALAAVFCGFDLVLGGRRVAPLARSKDRDACRKDIEQFRMPSHDATAMYRRSLVADLTYATCFVHAEAFDYVLRVGEIHPMAVLGECLYSYRVHFDSITRRSPLDRMRAVNSVLRRAYVRRGKAIPAELSEEAGLPDRLTNRDRDNNLAAFFIESAIDLKRRGEWWSSIETGLECVKMHPLDSHYYKALIYSVVPYRFAHLFRKA